jgi:hypothetical protein
MKNKNHAVNLLNNHINFLSQNQQAVVPESIVAQVQTVYFTMKENLPIIKKHQIRPNGGPNGGQPPGGR